jgi:hypothetical protein
MSWVAIHMVCPDRVGSKRKAEACVQRCTPATAFPAYIFHQRHGIQAKSAVSAATNVLLLGFRGWLALLLTDAAAAASSMHARAQACYILVEWLMFWVLSGLLCTRRAVIEPGQSKRHSSSKYHHAAEPISLEGRRVEHGVVELTENAALVFTQQARGLPDLASCRTY